MSRPSGFSPGLVAFFTRPHASEYIGVSILLALYLGIVVHLKPVLRMFHVNDLAISFPHADPEHVSVFMNFIYALYIPIFVIVGLNFFNKATVRKHEASLLAFFISILTSTILTDIIKNAVGRPRPDLLARCIPAPDTPTDRLVSISVCTAPPSHTLTDGFRSFPSGHSSFAFSGLGYLSLFLAGQFSTFTLAGRRNLWKALIAMSPLVGAALIAISRTEDYRHDVFDVSTGSLLGSVVAWWSYRRYFPTLGRDGCSEIEGENDLGEFQRIPQEGRDVELGDENIV